MAFSIFVINCYNDKKVLQANIGSGEELRRFRDRCNQSRLRCRVLDGSICYKSRYEGGKCFLDDPDISDTYSKGLSAVVASITSQQETIVYGV
jgi:hypothetical protein